MAAATEREKLYVIKIGGNVIDDDAALDHFLEQFAKLPGSKILVHGGGKLATRLADQLHLPQQMVEGRRITDKETLKVVTMVYAGYVNKTIVAKLYALDCPAMGITGADGDAIRSQKRMSGTLDYGFVGDVRQVNVPYLRRLLPDYAVVIAPITHDGAGQLLNTNADTIAQETAKALSDVYAVHLLYCFEKEGVLLDAEDDSTVISTLTPERYLDLKEKNKVFAGMLPKLDNAFAALHAGVAEVVIGKAEKISGLVNASAGTRMVLHD